ncbi:MAG: lipase family protein, partial [Planctomycetaceae bacterium]
VTGHSLGGALATLAARRLPAALKPFEVATFGQPRVGNVTFINGYMLRHNRYVNNHDIVPSVPPRFIPLTTIYAHVGDMQFFDGDGKLMATAAAAAAGNALGFTPELREHMAAEVTDVEAVEALAFAGVDDHDLENYIALIEGNLAVR